MTFKFKGAVVAILQIYLKFSLSTVVNRMLSNKHTLEHIRKKHFFTKSWRHLMHVLSSLAKLSRVFFFSQRKCGADLCSQRRFFTLSVKASLFMYRFVKTGYKYVKLQIRQTCVSEPHTINVS